MFGEFLEIVPKFSLVHEIGVVFLEGEVAVTGHLFADVRH